MQLPEKSKVWVMGVPPSWGVVSVWRRDAAVGVVGGEAECCVPVMGSALAAALASAPLMAVSVGACVSTRVRVMSLSAGTLVESVNVQVGVAVVGAAVDVCLEVAGALG